MYKCLHDFIYRCEEKSIDLQIPVTIDLSSTSIENWTFIMKDGYYHFKGNANIDVIKHFRGDVATW
jgi:hypothetical protein